MPVQLPVRFSDHSEQPRDTVKSWLRWFTDGVPWPVALVFVGLLGALGATLGWVQLPAYTLIFLTFVFFFGPFGAPYLAARIAHSWNYLRLPPPLPAAPPRQRFWLTGAAAVTLIVASTAACRWILGVGWDTRPLLDRLSPWSIPVIAAMGLIVGEIMVSWRMRREIRRRCREAIEAEAEMSPLEELVPLRPLQDEQTRGQS